MQCVVSFHVQNIHPSTHMALHGSFLAVTCSTTHVSCIVVRHATTHVTPYRSCMVDGQTPCRSIIIDPTTLAPSPCKRASTPGSPTDTGKGITWGTAHVLGANTDERRGVGAGRRRGPARGRQERSCVVPSRPMHARRFRRCMALWRASASCTCMYHACKAGWSRPRWWSRPRCRASPACREVRHRHLPHTSHACACAVFLSLPLPSYRHSSTRRTAASPICSVSCCDRRAYVVAPRRLVLPAHGVCGWVCTYTICHVAMLVCSLIKHQWGT